MPAHTMPPSVPANNKGTTIQALLVLSANKATPVANTAPMTYCPSAPMFHTLERKHSASPKAISNKGVALTTNSPTA